MQARCRLGFERRIDGAISTKTTSKSNDRITFIVAGKPTIASQSRYRPGAGWDWSCGLTPGAGINSTYG